MPFAALTKPSDAEAAYFAGFFDANGQLHVRDGTTPTLSIIFRRKRTEAIYKLAAFYRGSLYALRGNVLGLNLSTRASMVFLADVAHACRVRRDEIDLVLQGFSTKMTPYEADALSDALKVERERGWGDVALGRVEVRADPTDLDRAYCAGLIDGSSHVFSFVEKPGTPPSYGARVTIQPSRPEGVLTMQGFYGGTTYAAREKDRTNSYMIFRRQEVLRLFDDVLPFLLDRREDAQLAVERLRESRRRKVADAAVVEVASESMNEAHP